MWRTYTQPLKIRTTSSPTRGRTSTTRRSVGGPSRSRSKQLTARCSRTYHCSRTSCSTNTWSDSAASSSKSRTSTRSARHSRRAQTSMWITRRWSSNRQTRMPVNTTSSRRSRVKGGSATARSSRATTAPSVAGPTSCRSALRPPIARSCPTSRWRSTLVGSIQWQNVLNPRCYWNSSTTTTTL